MNEIHLLSEDERELFFRTATEIMNMSFEIIRLLSKFHSVG